MNDQELFELAKQAATELSYEWKIGNLSWEETIDGETSEAMFDDAPVEEIAKRLMPFMKRVLTSQKPPATVGLT